MILSTHSRVSFTLGFLSVLAATTCFVNASLTESSDVNKYDSYVNPNPRPYDTCNAQDLIKLSNCCNEVLNKLDDCKANDLACECCALQSMDKNCYNLCPNNPSNNFLTVLFNDCASLNDINACGLPFKKEDTIAFTSSEGKFKSKSKVKNKEDENFQTNSLVTVKSKIHNGNDDEVPKLKVNLLLNDDEDDFDKADPHKEPKASLNTASSQSKHSDVKVNKSMSDDTLSNSTTKSINVTNATKQQIGTLSFLFFFSVVPPNRVYKAKY